MDPTAPAAAPIEVVAPLESAWRRMVVLLFRPFDLASWFTVGLGAWLAHLGQGGVGGGFSPPFPGGGDLDGGDAEAVEDGVREAGRWLAESWPLVTAIGCTVLLVLAVIVVLVLWLQARGMFVFVDNVARGRPAVVEPWKRHAALANSAFLWLLGFTAVVLGLFLVLVSVVVAVFFVDLATEAKFVLALVLGIPALLVIAIGASLVGFFFRSFVIPIMLWQGVRANEAWRRFLPLVRAAPGPFALYTLLVLALHLLLAVAVVVVGCATCCLGFLVLVIPYIGTVALLPVWVTLRAYGLEFLAQFGPEYDLFGPPPPRLDSPAATL